LNTNSSSLMTEGKISGKIFNFAMPLFIGNLFQQLYNTADALIVGNFLGNDALAAVSSTGSLVFLMVCFFGGISAGAGVAISRFFGADEPEKMSTAIHTNIAFSLFASVFLTIVGTTCTPALLKLMGTPEDVMSGAVTYIRIYFAGCTGMIMYNGLRGVMQAVGDSKNPLRFLIVSSLVNIVLDILFIAVFGMGISGAAYATIISQFISVILCGYKLLTVNDTYRVEIKKIGFDLPMLKMIVGYGLPSGLQNSVIALANVVVQSNINAFGTMAVAGCGAYSKIEGFAFLPITAFTMALTTFIGQNLGAKEYDRAKKGASFGIICAVVLAELIGALSFVFAPTLIQFFTQEPEAVAYGVLKARTCALFYCLLAASHSYSAVLRGAGKAVIPMISMLLFWCLVRVSILRIFVPVFRTINVVNWVYPITWSLSTVFLIIYYYRADWIHGFEEKKRKV